MITVLISGPNTAERRKLADSLRTMLVTAGKVVRLYPDSRERPEVIPECDVAILVQQENASD